MTALILFRCLLLVESKVVQALLAVLVLAHLRVFVYFERNGVTLPCVVNLDPSLLWILWYPVAWSLVFRCRVRLLNIRVPWFNHQLLVEHHDIWLCFYRPLNNFIWWLLNISMLANYLLISLNLTLPALNPLTNPSILPRLIIYFDNLMLLNHWVIWILLLFARFFLLILIDFDLIQNLLQLILVLQELFVVLLVLSIDHLLLIFGRLTSRFGLVILDGVLRVDLVMR